MHDAHGLSVYFYNLTSDLHICTGTQAGIEEKTVLSIVYGDYSGGSTTFG